MGKQRNKEIDILRGLAAILMILGHSFIVYPVDISSVPWCHWTGHFIYTFHMELFFVLAGTVYHCSNYKYFISKKAKRILVPYLFFGIISLFLKAFGGSAINGNESLTEGITKLLFHGGNYWFLYVLFILFAIYPWLEKLFKERKIEMGVCLAVLIIRQFTGITHVFALSTLLYYIPYFMTGRILADKILQTRGGIANISKRTICITLISGVSVYCLIDLLEIKRGTDFGSILSFIRSMAIITVLYIIVCLILNNRAREDGLFYNIISDCGKYSLQLYLFNGFLLTALRIIICNLFHVTTPIIIVGGIWIGNLAITLVLCKYVLQKIPVLNVLLGLR